MPFLLGGAAMVLGFLLYRRIVYGSTRGPRSLTEDISAIPRSRKK